LPNAHGRSIVIKSAEAYLHGMANGRKPMTRK
jgi:hypothetical protein